MSITTFLFMCILHCERYFIISSQNANGIHSNYSNCIYSVVYLLCCIALPHEQHLKQCARMVCCVSSWITIVCLIVRVNRGFGASIIIFQNRLSCIQGLVTI